MLRHVTDEEIEQRVRVLRRVIGLQNQLRPDMMIVIQKLTTSFRHFASQQVPPPPHSFLRHPISGQDPQKGDDDDRDDEGCGRSGPRWAHVTPAQA